MRRQSLVLALAAVVAVLTLLAGCAKEAEESRATAPKEPTKLTQAMSIEVLDVLAREPMLVEHPSGTLFLAGYGSQVTGTDPKAVPHLWRSDDTGFNWTRVDVGTPEEGAIGNSDVDLTVGPDGTIYFASMGFDRSTREGTHVAMGVSRDVGATWEWTLLSETRFDDRPWVRVTPDGIAHAIWNDGSTIAHAVSADSGATWEERGAVHPGGGSSHFAVGPQGQLAVRVSPLAASANQFQEEHDLITISPDGGEHWIEHALPSEIEWDPTFSKPGAVLRWVEPLAWDEDGVLYHLWSEGQEIRLGWSRDEGFEWIFRTIFRDDAPSFFPYLVAKGSGELAATWFTGFGDEMVARAAYIRMSGEDTGHTVLISEPFQPESWQEREDQRTRDPAGEYLPVAFLRDGDIGVASPIQDLAGGRFGFTWRRFVIE